MNFDFQAEQVIVTGAGQGIGRAIAQAFDRAGAKVWICDIDTEALDQTRALCGSTCEARKVDVTDLQSVQKFIAEVGQVYVLVNCAGGVCGQAGQAIEDVTPDQWSAIFKVNVDSAFWFCQAVAPAMKRAGRGRIINISSGAGLGISLTGIQAYASAKAAQIGLTRQLAHEFGPFGITVNSVAPGFVRSNPSTERQWIAFGEEKQKAVLDGIALRKLGKPEYIADAVLFFASDLAEWVTGQTLSVDGGK